MPPMSTATIPTVSYDFLPSLPQPTPRSINGAEVTPVYGVRKVGGFGVRGWRVYCGRCDYLSRTYPNNRTCIEAQRNHLHSH